MRGRKRRQMNDLVEETVAAVRLTVVARLPEDESPSEFLRRAANRLERGPLDEDDRAVLFDLNGNRVGFVILADGPLGPLPDGVL